MRKNNSCSKAVSQSIEIVMIVALVIAIAIIVTSSLTGVIKTQTTVAEVTSKSCTGSALNVITSSATGTSLQVAVGNVGQNALTNFTVTAKRADNSIYTNTTAASTLSISKGSSAIITLADINSTVGCPLSELTVSAGNCPVFTKIDNTTKSIC